MSGVFYTGAHETKNTCLGDLVPWLAPIVPQASVVEVRPSRVGQRPGGIQPSGRCAPVRHYRGELALPGGGHMGKRHRGWRGTPLYSVRGGGWPPRGAFSHSPRSTLLPFKDLAIVDAMAVRPLLCLVYAPLLISATSALRRVLQPADGPGPPLESIILDKLASYNAPLHLFMWGDSTMQRQQDVLATLVQSNATFRTATDILLPVALPASLDLGTTRPVMCESVNVQTQSARLGGTDFSLTAAICKHGVLSIAMVPRALDVLVTEHALPTPTLLYIGGGGLHHTHDETMSKNAGSNACGCVRDWDSMRPLVNDSYEARLEYGLRGLESAYPKASLAYFNTHWLCTPKLRQGMSFTPLQHQAAVARATACEAGDEACFGCPAVHDDACWHDPPAVAPEDRDLFNATVYGPTGVESLAARESRGVRAAGARWGLVDGYALTRNRCAQTTDGEHYDDETTLNEIDAALAFV